MSEKTLYDLLVTLNKPVAYDHFTNDDTIPPFILYRNIDTNTFKADDKVYAKSNNYIVDLITDKKDTTTEGSLETLFTSNNLPFDKSEDFIESERIFQIRYFI